MSVTEGLLNALRLAESNGNPNARSPAGALGAYQFMPGTARQFGIDPLDEGQSREAARKYLTQLTQQFGSTEKALQAYNWGPGNMRAFEANGTGSRGQEMPPETQAYVQRVMSKMEPAQPGRDLSGELFGNAKPAAGRDLSGELFGNAKPAAQQRSPMDEIGRQLGLTARAGIGGAANTVGMLSDPIASVLGLAGKGINSLTGRQTLPTDYGTARDMGGRLSDAMGLPTPQTAQERVVGGAAELMGSAGSTAGLASLAGRVGGPAAARAGEILASRPAQQVGAAAGAGLAGGASRENGDGTLAQMAWAAAGGVGGGLLGQGVVNRLPMARPDTMPIEQIQARLAQTIKDETGLEWTRIPKAMQGQLTQQAAEQFNKTGTLPAQAAARMAEFDALGIDPLKPWVTRDPIQYSRMMNLRGTDAGAPIQNRMSQANSQMIGRMNELSPGAPGSTMDRGQMVIGDLAGKNRSMQAVVGQAYDTAAKASGRDLMVPINNYVGDLVGLAEDFGGAFPAAIRARMDRIGMFGGDQIKTVSLRDTESWLQAMNRVPASTQAEKAAQGAVRGVIQRMQTEFGGTSGLAGEAASAAQSARQAAAERFRWQDAVPLVKEILSGDATPDRLIEQTIMSRSASTKDVRNLMMSLSETSRDAVRSEVIDSLKRRMLSNATDEVGVVSQSALKTALAGIPKEKLAALLGDQADEVYRISRVASYIQARPAGHAVNESMTSNAMLGQLGRMSRNLPVVGPMVAEPMQNLLRQYQVRQLLAQGIGSGGPGRAPLLGGPSGYVAGLPALTAGMSGLIGYPGDDRENRQR